MSWRSQPFKRGVGNFWEFRSGPVVDMVTKHIPKIWHPKTWPIFGHPWVWCQPSTICQPEDIQSLTETERRYVTLKPLGIQSPCQMMIGVYNHLLSKVFRFHYHSQKVIGSLGNIQKKHLLLSFGMTGCFFVCFFLIPTGQSTSFVTWIKIFNKKSRGNSPKSSTAPENIEIKPLMCCACVFFC